jgi:hypothetical protein
MQLNGKSKALGLSVLALTAASVLETPVQAVQLQQGFDGAYAPANWSLAVNGGNGSGSTARDLGSIGLTGSDSGFIAFINTNYTTRALASGPVSFHWEYVSVDTGAYDGFGFLLNNIFTQLALNDSKGSGSAQFNVLAGDIFGFRVFSVDNLTKPGVATISNFSAPVPGPLPFLGVGAAFSYSRRLRRRIGLCNSSVRPHQGSAKALL